MLLRDAICMTATLHGFGIRRLGKRIVPFGKLVQQVVSLMQLYIGLLTIMLSTGLQMYNESPRRCWFGQVLHVVKRPTGWNK